MDEQTIPDSEKSSPELDILRAEDIDEDSHCDSERYRGLRVHGRRVSRIAHRCASLRLDGYIAVKMGFISERCN